MEGLSVFLKLNKLDGQPIVAFPDAKPIETLNVVDTAALVHKNDDSGSFAPPMKPQMLRRRKGKIEPPTEAEIKVMEKQKRAKVALAAIGNHEAPTKVEGKRCGVCRM